MAIPDYPNNPAVDDEFTVGLVTFIWDGEKWRRKPLPSLAPDASNIQYDNIGTALSSGNVQNAVTEVAAKAYEQVVATAVQYDNTASELTATNTQGAIDELDGGIEALASQTVRVFTSVQDMNTFSTTGLASGYVANAGGTEFVWSGTAWEPRGDVLANSWGLDVGNTPIQNTQALQAAIDYVQNLGGGKVLIEFDTSAYVFAQSESAEVFDDDGAALSPNDINAGCCIVLRENVKIESSQGRAKLQSESPRQSVIWVISPDGAGVKGFDISGGWDSITGAGHGILQISKTIGNDTNTGFRVEDNIIHDVASYAIGVQTGNVENLRVIDNITYNTGADGIDVKGRGSADGETFNIIISRNRIGKFGYRSNLSDQAGIDVRGLAIVKSNTVFNVEDVTPDGAARTGIRCRPAGTGRVFGSTMSKVIGNHVESNNIANFRAFAVNSNLIKVIGNTAKNAVFGFRVDRNSTDNIPNTQTTVALNSAEGCVVGYSSRPGVELCNFHGNVDRDCSEAYRLDGNDTLVTDVNSFNATTFVRFISSGNSVKGGKITGAVTTKVRDNEGGASNTVTDVDGIRVRQRSQSLAVDISTVGLKTVTVPHSLALPPTSPSQVIGSLRSTSTDVEASLVACTSVDANNATFYVKVSKVGTGDVRVVADISFYL